MVNLELRTRSASDNSVVTQNLVADTTGILHGIPGQNVLIVLQLNLQVLRGRRRSHIASLKARKTDGILSTVNTQRTVNIAANPQGALRIHERLPDTESVVTLNSRGELRQHLTAVLIESSNQLDRVNHARTAHGGPLVTRILVEEVAAVAGAVDGVTVQVQILEVSTIAGNRGVGGGQGRLIVTRDEVLGTAHPDAGTGILDVELETPNFGFITQVRDISASRNLRLLVRPRAALLHMLSNISHAVGKATVEPGEVTGYVNMRVISGGANTVDSTVEHLAPVTVYTHNTGHTVRRLAQLKTGNIARIRLTRLFTFINVGKGAANIHVVTLTVNGLHCHDLGTNAIFDFNLGPFRGNFTGCGVNNDEALMLLTVNKLEVTANSQTVIRQSLNSLHLTVNSQLKIAAQLAGHRVKSSNIRLRNTLTGRGLKVLEVATNKHAGGAVTVIDLGNGLNVGVHFAGFTGGGPGAGSPAPIRRTAIGQGTTSARRGTGIRDSAQVQIILGQLRAQEHLGVTERGLTVAFLTVDVGVPRIGDCRLRAILRNGRVCTVTETHTVILGRQLIKHQSLEAVVLSTQNVVFPRAIRPVPAAIFIVGRELVRVGDGRIRPDSARAQSPGPLGSLTAVNRRLLPLGARGVQRATETVTIGQLIGAGAVEQLRNGGTRKLNRGLRGGQGAQSFALFKSHTGRCGCGIAVELRSVTLTFIVFSPAVAALTNLDPAATISFLIAVELSRLTHRRSVQPIGAALCLGVSLLGFPTASGSTLGGRAIVESRVPFFRSLFDSGTRRNSGDSYGQSQRRSNAQAKS